MYFSKSKSFEQYIKTAATGIANFLKSAQDLQASAQKLLKKDHSAFLARTAETSDSKKVVAAASPGTARKTYEINVNAIATSQINSGTLLSIAAPSVVSKGINQFNITTGGKTMEVAVFISDNDTNDQALAKLKDAIHAAKMGITASRVTDDKTGNKKLELNSNKTGEDQAFEVEDVAGNAMSSTGIKHAVQLASNTSYSVNGGATQTSQSNTIDLEKGKAAATLMAISSEAANIQIKPDEDKVIAQVKDLVSSYNTMHDRLKEASGVMNSFVRKSMESIVNSSVYERIGIHRSGDGTLKLDEEQLMMSLNANFEQTSKTIGGNYGLAERLLTATGRYNEVPASSLLNAKALQVQQFTMYQSSMQIAMFTQANGWIVNSFY